MKHPRVLFPFVLLALLAATAAGQETLLNLPLASRALPKDLAGLDKLEQQIENAQAVVGKEAESPTRKELLEALKVQLDAVTAARELRKSTVESQNALNQQLAQVQGAGDPAPPVPLAEVDGVSDPTQATELSTRISGELDKRRTAVKSLETKQAEWQKRRSDGSGLVASRGDATSKARAAWEAAKKKVTDQAAEVTDANVRRLAREQAYAQGLVFLQQEIAYEKLQREMDRSRVEAGIKLVEAQLARAQSGVTIAETQTTRIKTRLEELNAEADRVRALDRESVQADLEGAEPWAKPFYQMQLEKLDADAAALASKGALARWKNRVSVGVLHFCIQDVGELGGDLADEEFEFTTGQLRTRIRSSEEALVALQTAYRELGQDRVGARRSYKEAERRLREHERGVWQARREAARQAAEEANAPDRSLLEKSWDERTVQYKAALTAWKEEAGKLRTDTLLESKKLATNIDSCTEFIAKMQARLLWTREESLITRAALDQAFSDAQRLPDNTTDGFSDTFGAWRAAVESEQNRSRVIAMAILVGLMGFLLWFTHRKLPATYSWLETRDGDQSGLLQVLVAGIRRTEFVFMIAVFYCGLCAVWGVWPWATGPVAVFALSPFAYRFLRVLLDVLFHPTDTRNRLIDVDNKLAATITRTGRWLLNLSLVFVPVGLLMSISYQEYNPGFVELWWFVYTTLFSVLLLVGLFRPSVIRRMIRGKGHLAAAIKTLILVVYPLAFAAVIFLLVLNSLRYREAVHYFRGNFLTTIGMIVVSWFIYRWVMRKMLPERDFSEVTLREDFEDEEQFLAHGRREFYDRLARVGLRLVVALPLFIVLAGIWRQMDWSFMDAPMFGEGGRLTGKGLLWGGLALWATIVLLRHYRRWMRFVVLPATKLDQGLGYAVLTLTSYVLVWIGVVIGLNILRVDGDQIAWVLSALMVGIGFGLKDVVTNFISGIMLLVERPLKVGDQIVIGDQTGTVEKINLRSTTIMTFENIGVVVPNADLVTGTLINRSAGSPLLRTTIPIGVGYDSDPREVHDIIKAVVTAHGQVLKRPGPSIYFTGYGADALDFSLRFWAKMGDNRMKIAGDLRAALLSKFREAGIEIPYPQRDLHLKTVAPEAILKTATPGHDGVGAGAAPSRDASTTSTGGGSSGPAISDPSVDGIDLREAQEGPDDDDDDDGGGR